MNTLVQEVTLVCWPLMLTEMLSMKTTETATTAEGTLAEKPLEATEGVEPDSSVEDTSSPLWFLK